jgi:hypothetical protein
MDLEWDSRQASLFAPDKENKSPQDMGPEGLSLTMEAIARLERSLARVRLSLRKHGIPEDVEAGDEDQPPQDDQVVPGVFSYLLGL